MGILDTVRGWFEAEDAEDFGDGDALEDSGRWAKRVEIKAGALRGWSKDLPAGERHRILDRVVSKDGYATTSRRLNFLCNVTKDRPTRKAACGDLSWLQREYPAEEEED